jgi:hypothetical protein
MHENNILYCKFGASGIGLCNQLYSLVNTMVKGSVLEGNTLVVVDDFKGDLNSNQYHDSSTIVDFPRMNAYLDGVTLISKHSVQMESMKIEYGLTDNTIVDITNIMMELFYTRNRLCIPRGTSLNRVIGFDPCENVRKQLYITYTINGFIFHETRDEIIDHEDVCIDFVNWHTKPWMSPTSIYDCSKDRIDTFNFFLNNIYFNEIYETYANSFVSDNKCNGNKKINVIHLRLEEDAIPFWSSINRISCEEYETALVRQYIENIKEYIDPSDSINVILSMNTCNPVTKWMTENKYEFIQMSKTTVQGREVNAIIDLLISSKCNHVFIGNVNPYNYHGSTFSYAIFNALRGKESVKKICIDNDDIYHPAYIVN